MPRGKITILFSRVDGGLSHHFALDLDVNHAERHKLLSRDGTSDVTLQLTTLYRHCPPGVKDALISEFIFPYRPSSNN